MEGVPLSDQPRKTGLAAGALGIVPGELRTPNQVAGRHLTHCGFMTGASYCSFRCTHCYLPKKANEIPIPSFAQMKEQIDANRRFQGPGAGLQITGGDVADAYWRTNRAGELVAIVALRRRRRSGSDVDDARADPAGTSEIPGALVVEGGLRQMAVHIDMTQAARAGYPIRRLTSEADLHPVRQAFTDLALQVRARTGLPFELSHNCTVTERNIDSIAEVVRWFLDDPRRSKIWRILSFQPEANTGRTTYSQHPVTPAIAWREICRVSASPSMAAPSSAVIPIATRA